MRTLHKKPGALRGSTALLQADTQIKYIYEHYYIQDAKTFLQVLGLIYEKGTNAVMKALNELELLSPMDMSFDKVKVICENRQVKKTFISVPSTDHLTEKSRNTLAAYDKLAALQSGKLNKEAI